MDMCVTRGTDLYGKYVTVTFGRFEQTHRCTADGVWLRPERRAWTERFRPGMPTDTEALELLNAFNPAQEVVLPAAKGR